MTYELCKKLKDAGFPQTGKGELYETEEGRLSREKMGPIDSVGTYLTQVVYFPTLSELIEACGNKFEAFERHEHAQGTKWCAVGYIDGEDDVRVFTEKTPEEAVANLWLALNKK